MEREMGTVCKVGAGDRGKIDRFFVGRRGSFVYGRVFTRHSARLKFAGDCFNFSVVNGPLE